MAGADHMGGFGLFMRGGKLSDTKNTTIKYVLDLHGCYDISHATTNQIHAGAMERVYRSRCVQGRARRGDETIVLGGIRSWEEVKTYNKYLELTT